MQGVKILFVAFIFLLSINFSLQKIGRCFMIPDKDSTISGEVKFEQENESSPVNVQVTVYGAKSIHGFHIHEKGTIENGCISAGAHYNPLNQPHGGPDTDIRHMGDLGNLETKDGNSIVHKFTNDKISLFGEYSILGRTCVVHAYEDDLGKGENQESAKTGNSGPRLACGVVQPYDPMYSIIFGLSTLIIGISLSFYYFFCYKKTQDSQSNLVEGEVRAA
jgi:superoxide dismutase, Cu-Zn family